MLNTDHTEIIASSYTLAILLLLAALHYAPRYGERKHPTYVFLGMSWLFVLVARLPIFAYDPILNVDEALMAANAMQAHYGWLDWHIIDPLTSGPVNSAILTWPYLFGGDITIYSTRLTGAVLCCGIFSFLFLTARRISGAEVSILAIFPLVLFVGSAQYSDFVHYSSEQMPLFLLAAAIYSFTLSLASSRLLPLLITAFLLGLVPFAKLQLTPVAATIGAAVVIRALTTKHPVFSIGSKLAAITGIASIPALLFTLPLILHGAFSDFINSYFIQQKLRIVTWSDQVPKMLHKTRSFLAFTVSTIILLVSAIIAHVNERSRASIPISLNQKWLAILSIAMLAASYLAATAPGREYKHYLLIFLPALALFTIVSLSIAYRTKTPRLWTSIVVILLIASITLPAARKQSFDPTRANGAFLHGRPFTSAHLLQWLRPVPGDRIVCWGWRPGCYIDSGMPSATREATNENQLYETSLKGYFRERFLNDFQKSKPDFVLDTITPTSFHFTDPETQSIDTFPSFAQIIHSEYQQISSIHPGNHCPRLYVKHARMAALDQDRIKFKSISASSSMNGYDISAIDDGSVFEACADYWLPDEKQLAVVNIQFNDIEPVASIAILNTRNGDTGNRAAQTLHLALLIRDSVTYENDINLLPYPYWTIVNLDHRINADRIKINLLNFNAMGAGLNEVKLYRN